MSEDAKRIAAEDHYYAALDFYAEGHHQQAIVEYRCAIEADPRFLDAMHGLARVYQDTEQYDDAIAIATRITELDPDDVLAHTSLSTFYQRKGMIPEAEAESAKAKMLDWKQQLAANKKSPSETA